jgi:hypothetical protein
MAARKRSALPGDAEKPETIPAARDGKPDEDELARRRAEKANGTSVAERMQGAEGGSNDAPEMFPHGSLEGDPKVTYKNLVKSGARVTVTASLTSAEVPITGGGLFDPEKEGLALVRFLPGQVALVPQHKDKHGESRVEEWTLRQTLRTLRADPAEDMYTRVQVLELLHEAGVPSATISKLLGEGPQTAQA